MQVNKTDQTILIDTINGKEIGNMIANCDDLFKTDDHDEEAFKATNRLYATDPVTISVPMTDEERAHFDKAVFDVIYLPEAAKRLMRKLGYWEGME